MFEELFLNKKEEELYQLEKKFILSKDDMKKSLKVATSSALQTFISMNNSYISYLELTQEVR